MRVDQNLSPEVIIMSGFFFFAALSSGSSEELECCLLSVAMLNFDDLKESNKKVKDYYRRCSDRLSQLDQVHERLVDVEELLASDEVFCTGTAVVVNPVGSITYNTRRVKYNDGAVGEVAQDL